MRHRGYDFPYFEGYAAIATEALELSWMLVALLKLPISILLSVFSLL